MGYRLRSLRYALLISVLFAIAALPGLWSDQTPGSSFGPAIAWAGGTPDETLNPPPTPPPSGGGKKSSGDYGYATGSTEVGTDAPAIQVTTDRPSRWGLIWLVIRSTVLRI
ncbi:MAG TPA: hypothetical protein VFT32_10260 [Candidatus Eisenbacteria bacterium]|nr:hypothetical protein [Candidatus Eisenbacteria bacterium]